MEKSTFEHSGHVKNVSIQPDHEGTWQHLNYLGGLGGGRDRLTLDDDVNESRLDYKNIVRTDNLLFSPDVSSPEHSSASTFSSSVTSEACEVSEFDNTWSFPPVALTNFSSGQDDDVFRQTPFSGLPQSSVLTSLSRSRSDETSDTCSSGSEVTGAPSRVLVDTREVCEMLPPPPPSEPGLRLPPDDDPSSGQGRSAMIMHSEVIGIAAIVSCDHSTINVPLHCSSDNTRATDDTVDDMADEPVNSCLRQDETQSFLPADSDQTFVAQATSESAQNKKRRKKGFVSEDAEAKAGLKLPPCRICAQPASGFHYGVNSCEACKGFFQRCLNRRRPYKCKGGEGRCVVSRGARLPCAHCRYQKCLSLGMSKDAVRIGRYTHETRTQNTLEVRMLTTQEAPLFMGETEAEVMIAQLMEARKCEGRLSVEMDEQYLEKTWMEVQDNYRLHEAVFGSMETLDAREVEEVYRLTGLDVDNRKAQMERLANRIEKKVLKMIQFAKGIPGFRELACQDQIALLKGGRVEFAFLTMYHGFSTHHSAFAAPCGKGVHKRQFEKLYGKEYTEYQFRLAESLKRLRLQNDELVLVQSILLTSADRCVLQNRQQVETLQWTLIRCLFRRLQQQHEDLVMARFAQIVDQMTALRTLTEMAVKIFSSPAFLDILKKKPVLVEMILQ